MTDVMCPSPLPSVTFGMPDPAFLPAPGGLPKGDAQDGAIPGTSPKCQLPHRSPWHCRLRRGRVSVSSTAWLSPLRGKPGSPLTLRGTGERPSRGWRSFSVALSLTFNENKQAGMGRRCGRAAWPCAGRWPRTAASTAQALHKDGQSRGGAGSDAIPWGEAAGVKSRVVAAAHGSRQDGTLPVGGESRGDASCPGKVGDLVFMQVLEGWGGIGLCSVLGCRLPTAWALAWRLQDGGHLGWFFFGCFSEPAQPHQLQLLSQCG